MTILHFAFASSARDKKFRVNCTSIQGKNAIFDSAS